MGPQRKCHEQTIWFAHECVFTLAGRSQLSVVPQLRERERLEAGICDLHCINVDGIIISGLQVAQTNKHRSRYIYKRNTCLHEKVLTLKQSLLIHQPERKRRKQQNSSFQCHFFNYNTLKKFHRYIWDIFVNDLNI